MNGNNIILMKHLSSMFLYLILMLVLPSGSALNANSPGTFNFVTIYPAFQCSAFCMYQINSNFNYDSLCTAAITTA